MKKSTKQAPISAIVFAILSAVILPALVYFGITHSGTMNSILIGIWTLIACESYSKVIKHYKKDNK